MTAWIGRSLRRVEDPALVAGLGRFTADAAIGAASVRFVRSPVARGRIVSIEKPDGLVFTAEDLAGTTPIHAILHRPDYVDVPQPLLACDRVVFVGQAICAVVAEDGARAEDLAESVFVEIESETPVVDLAAALTADAPAVHPEAPGNVIVEGRMESAGLADAFAAAAEVVTIDIRSRRQSAMPLEPRGGVATPDPVTGRITLTASVQMPHMLRTGIADVLGLPESELRVVAPDVGGGFGQKMSLFPEYAVLVWLARCLGRPVAWIEDRRENFLASAHSRDQKIALRAAFDAQARLTALDATIDCNVGAFSCYPVTCGVEPLMAFAELPGPYAVGQYAARARGVVTNTCTMAPYRGVSRPTLTFTMERLMDVAAKRFGLDPIEIRRRNLITTFPHRSPTGLVHDEGSYRQALDKAAELVDLPDFRARQATARKEGRYIGIGFSVFSERTGYGTPAFAARGMEIIPGYEEVECQMDPSGFVEVRIGASPHGQGLRTSLAQLVADELGMDPSRIRIVAGDTDRTPYGWGTFASRSMVIAGGAGKRAAGKVAAKIKAIAGILLEADAADIDLVDGYARLRGSNRSLPMSEIARVAYHQSSRLKIFGPGLRESAVYDPAGTFSNACHVANVEVDIETGGVKILMFHVVEDAGILINPMIVDGQIHGGVAQGVGNALFEELVYDDDGNLLTASLADYLPPTSAEVPQIDIAHMVTLSDATETGAKGVGEGGLIGAPAAIINAIVDALTPFNVEIFEMPATPQRIHDLIEAARQASHG